MTLFLSGSACAVVPVPHVTAEMETPEFWIERLADRSDIVLDSESRRRLNEIIRRRGFRVDPTYEHERVPRRNTVRILKEQLEGLTHWRKYDRENNRLRDPGFNRRMGALVRIEDIPETIEVRYGLTVRRTRVRLMPTEMLLQRKPDEPQFDILQSSVVDIGQAVALYHISRDGEWGAVQTPACFGWVPLADVAWADGKDRVNDYLAGRPRIVALANSVTIFADSAMRKSLSHLGMGNWLPLDDRIAGGYRVRIPRRTEAGELSFGHAFIRGSEDTREGYPVITGEAIIRAAFRQLGDPYGWGGTDVGTDCSKFISNVFSVFGLEMPRTSFLQIKSLSVLPAPGRSAEKAAFLRSLPPARTLLQFPGHIGLYLGTVGGRHYIIHSLSAYRVPENGGEAERRVDRVLVSDLSLGKGSRKGSFFENIEKAGVLR